MYKIFSLLSSKYINLPSPAKASLWFTLCYVLQRGIQFLSMPILTRIMSVEEYGIYSLFLSWYNIICVVTSLNIYAGVFNKAMVKYEDKRKEYISSIQWLTAIICVIFGIGGLVFKVYVTEITEISSNLIVLMVLHLFTFPTLQYWSQEQRFYFKYKAMVIVTLLNSVLGLLVGMICVCFAEDKAYTIILITVLIQFIICSYIFCTLAARGRCFYNKEFWLWSLTMAIPLIPHALSEILLGHSARIMIANICGVAQAGIFNIIYMISMVMTIIRQGINGSFTPWTYQALKSKNFNGIRKISSLLVLANSVLAAFFMLIAPELLFIAAPSEYQEAVVDMPPIMMGCFFIFLYVMFVNIEIYYEKTTNVAVASVFAAGVNIVLNYIFIPLYGYLVAGYVTMISYFVLLVMHYYFYRNIVRDNPELDAVFNIKLFAINIVCLLWFGLICLTLYDYTYMRYLFMVIILIVGLKNRNILVNKLKLTKSI